MLRSVQLYSITIIGLSLVWTVNGGDDCSSQLRVLSKTCQCNLIGELGVDSIVTIYCPYENNEYVHIKKYDDNDGRYDYTSIHCMGYNIGDRSMHEIIPAMKLGAEDTVKLDLDCPLGNTTVRNYLDRLGITSVKHLHLTFVGEFGTSSKITKGIFAGALSIRTLNLVKKKIRSLPSDVFEHLTNVRKIDLSDNKFNSLDSATFIKNKKLKKLTFDRNSQRLTLPSGLLSDLPLLENASFQFSHIKSVPGDLFNGSENVISITLAMNEIETIPQTLFHSQIRLVDLRLGGNNIRTLPVNLFKTNVELQKLDLYSNQLTSLPADLFENNRKLKKINLGGNKIQMIPRNLFTSLEQLDELNLSRNEIQHLTADMLPVQITSFKLDRNRLAIIDTNFLKRFQDGHYRLFSISENPLTCECNDNLLKLGEVSSKIKEFWNYRCSNVPNYITVVINECKRSSS